jgi:hypothetical protein
VEDHQVSEKVAVELQDPLEFVELLGIDGEVGHHVVTVLLVFDGIGQLTLAPVLDGGDLTGSLAGDLLVVGVEPGLDLLFLELRVEDVDDFVIAHSLDSSGLVRPRGLPGAGVDVRPGLAPLRGTAGPF